MSSERRPAAMVAAMRRPVALALSGGGGKGAAQAGAVAELVVAGLRPDLVVGTSIGAWNGAWLCSHPGPEGALALREWWVDAEVRQVLRGLWLGYAGAIAWRRGAALSEARVERLLDRGLGALDFAELPIPLAVGVADLLTADLVYLDTGRVATAVRASSSIPTVLPPVALEDRLFVDGGIVDNFGVQEAIRRGARTVVLVDASGRASVDRPPVRLGEIIDRSLFVSQVHQRRRSLASAFEAGVPLHVLEVGWLGSTLDFARAAEAFTVGRHVARAWLRGEVALPQIPMQEEERRRIVGRWRTVETRLRRRVTSLPSSLRRRNGIGAEAAGEAGAGEPSAEAAGG